MEASNLGRLLLLGRDHAHVRCLKPLRPFLDLKLHPGTFFQGRKALAGNPNALDRTEVNEDVRAAAVRGDETVALLGAKPLHRAVCGPVSTSGAVTVSASVRLSGSVGVPVFDVVSGADGAPGCVEASDVVGVTVSAAAGSD